MASVFECIIILMIGGILVNATKSPCCFSRRFVSNITIVTITIPDDGSKPMVSENRIHGVYDKDLRRVKAKGYIVFGAGSNQTKTVYNVLNDYNTGKRYGFINNAANCTIESMYDPQLDNCVPSSLRLSSTYIIGSENDAVRVNSWVGISGPYTYTYVTTVDDCTPISVNKYGSTTGGSAMIQNMQFSEFTHLTKMDMSNEFDIPKGC